MKHLSPGDVHVWGTVGVGKHLPGRLLWRDAGGREKLTMRRPGFYAQQGGSYKPRTNPFQPRPPKSLSFLSPLPAVLPHAEYGDWGLIAVVLLGGPSSALPSHPELRSSLYKLSICFCSQPRAPDGLRGAEEAGGGHTL